MNTEVNTRTHCGWSNWRKMPCVLCDKIVPPHVKGKFHTMIVRASYAVRDGDGGNDQLPCEETASDRNGDGTTWEKKSKKTEADMDGLCQPGHEGKRNNKRGSPRKNWQEENCVCRSDPTPTWERLEEEDNP